MDMFKNTIPVSEKNFTFLIVVPKNDRNYYVLFRHYKVLNSFKSFTFLQGGTYLFPPPFETKTVFFLPALLVYHHLILSLNLSTFSSFSAFLKTKRCSCMRRRKLNFTDMFFQSGAVFV